MLGSLTLLLTSIWSSCRLRPARSLHWMEPNLLLLKSHLCLPSLKRKALPSSSYTSPPEDPLTLPSPASLPPLDPVFCLLDPVFCLLDPVFCLLDPIFCLLSSRSNLLSKSIWVLSRCIMKLISDQNQWWIELTVGHIWTILVETCQAIPQSGNILTFILGKVQI